MPETPKRSIKEHWEGYSKACYPDGMQLDQSLQVKQSFYAGATVLADLMLNCPDDEEEAIASFMEELKVFAAPFQRVK